ncbi:MAG: lytic murein transglycosylase [Nitrospirota bacterium]
MIKMYFKKSIGIIAVILTSVMLTASFASADGFVEWLELLRDEAISRGISEQTLDTALAGAQPLERVIELDRNQPEFKKDYQSYLKMTVTEFRIKKGRKMLEEHRALLENISTQYGVQPRFLVAIWGMETNFGTYLGSFPIINSLVTLAYDERRSKFFRAELLNALRILDEGHITVSDMKGSWAGAMGQVQFMPSTFISFAVDGDKDGRKDLWHSLPDVFASASNYLSRYNWSGNWTWGREVLLPPGFDQEMAGMKINKLLSEWQDLGIRRINGDNLPEAPINASLILPSGSSGPAFLVYQNYRAIYRWNRSHFYALAVCRLSDRIKE